MGTSILLVVSVFVLIETPAEFTKLLTWNFIKLLLLLSAATSAIGIYPLFKSIQNQLSVKAERVADNTLVFKRLLRALLKWSLLVFAGMLLIGLVVPDPLNFQHFLLSVKIGFAEGLLITLLAETISNLKYLETRKKANFLKNEKPKYFRWNWIQATIFMSIGTVPLAFLEYKRRHVGYSSDLFTLYIPLALLLALGFGLFIRFQNKRREKRSQ